MKMYDDGLITVTLAQRGKYCSIDPIIGGSLIMGGSALAGGALSGMFGSSAAKKQADAIREATAEQRRQYNENVARLKPYTEFGGEQLNVLGDWLQDPTKQPMNYLDPGYKFREEQGMKGLYGNAATAGMLQSGDTLRAAQNYGQGLASTEYGNAFNRWLNEGGFRQGLAQMGQNSAINQAYLGQNNVNALSNLLSNRGTAEAGGQLAIGKSLADSVSGTGGLIGNVLARYLQNQKPDDTAWQFADPNAGWTGWGGTLQDQKALVPGGSNIFMSTNAAGAPMEY